MPKLTILATPSLKSGQFWPFCQNPGNHEKVVNSVFFMKFRENMKKWLLSVFSLIPQQRVMHLYDHFSPFLPPLGTTTGTPPIPLFFPKTTVWDQHRVPWFNVPSEPITRVLTKMTENGQNTENSRKLTKNGSKSGPKSGQKPRLKSRNQRVLTGTRKLTGSQGLWLFWEPLKTWKITKMSKFPVFSDQNGWFTGPWWAFLTTVDSFGLLTSP